jgi:hypothetical protein
MQRWPSGFTNAFLVVYALDGALSLAEELLRLATGSAALLLPRNALALTVLWAAMLATPLLALTPRLPARLLLPLFASAVWLNHGAAPLPLWLEGPALGITAAALQAGAAALAFLWLLRRNGGQHPWWAPGPEVPALSAGHSLRVGGVLVLGVVPATLLYAVVLLVTSIEVGTHGFVAFDRAGVSLDDRSYARGDREVRLVGMMHVGEEASYREVVTSFSVPSTVVLEEGVTDRSGLLEAPLSYDGVAGVLGLAPQDDLSTYLSDPETEQAPEWPVLRHADLDLADFDPETVAWLGRAQAVWDAEGLGQALREALRASSERPEVLAAVQRDVFERRNEHLLAELDAALVEYERVVIPWGALHLPALEAGLLERGFRPAASQRRRLLSWRTVGRALF